MGLYVSVKEVSHQKVLGKGAYRYKHAGDWRT